MTSFNWIAAIRRFGTGYVISIPAKDLKKMGWCVGDSLRIRAEKDNFSGVKYDDESDD